jgi:sigma-B regulation protein RsbU (phosphoserine phosphatase)
MMGSQASLRRLQLSNYKLDTLLSITQAINDNLPTEELLQRYEIILRDELNIGKLVVYSYNAGWECILFSGIKENVCPNINVDNDLLKYSEIEYISTGDNKKNKRLFKKTVRQERIKKELELASKMQNMLIPDAENFPKHDKFQVLAYYRPHFEVGGDYYDFISLGDNEYGFCIADVSGKGISAALLMSNFQASLRVLFTSNVSMKMLVNKLNETVMANAKAEKFITLFIAKYNSQTNVLTYINAGHNPPIYYDNITDEISTLNDGCVGLGMVDEIPIINEGKLHISNPSKLLCFTDGLVEIENNNSIEFGTENLKSCLSKKETIDLVLEDIIKNLDQHKGDGTYFDDISILAMEFY